jgi:hypothetical protein
MSRWLSIALIAAACADTRASIDNASDGITDAPDTEPWPEGPTFVDLGGDAAARELLPRPTRGGTMLASRDGTRMFVGDPDRDLFFVVDIDSRTVVHEIDVGPAGATEPGRIVEDGRDRVHVVLRRTGEVATLDVATGEIVDVRPVCPSPQGIAIDTSGAVLVSCTHGVLVRLHADGSEQRIDVGLDLGDIVDAGPPVRVATTRTPRVATLDDDGVVVRWQVPRSVGVHGGQFVQTEPDGVAYPSDAFDEVLIPNSVRRTFAATAALGDDSSTKARPGWLMLHQLASGRPLRPEPSGYGSDACIPAQATVVSHAAYDGDVVRSWPLDSIAPAFDLASTHDGSLAAVIGGIEGGWGMTFVNDDFTPRTVLPSCRPRNSVDLPGQPISVAFDSTGHAWVQLREPSALLLVEPDEREIVDEVTLSGDSVLDVGHDLFHRPTGSMLACVSCHPDGGDDGRIWTFAGLGSRRTQPLAVHLDGSEPLHWRGEFADFTDLALEVRGERMGGPDLDREEVTALERWIYELEPPIVPTADLDLEAAARGREIFDDLGCDVCHSGERLTNDATVQLGQRGYLQVPSLIGVVSRGPWMHDGRSATIEAAIEDMLTVGGAGAVVLGRDEMADVVEYLRSVG